MTTLSSSIADLEPLIREHADQAESARVMAPEVMTALVDAGLMRMWVPKALGGLEMDPNESLDAMEELARIDSAAGWVVSNSCFVSTACQFLPPESFEEILGDPAAMICGSFVPPGEARAVDGGYRVTGNWTFGSAVDYATTVITLTMLTDDNGMVIGEDGAPVSVIAFLRPDEINVLDTWRTLGLRATGSTNFTATDVEVPADRTFLMGPWESLDGPFSGPLYKLGLIMDAVRIGKVAVGIAQGALDDFVELAGAKTPAYTATTTADRATVQERVARAQALVQAGRSSISATVADAFATVHDGPRISGTAAVPMGLAATFALDSSVQAVDLLHESSGSTAFRDESPIQRRFRDLQTLRQNAIASWSRYESLGKMILGRDSDWPFHQL